MTRRARSSASPESEPVYVDQPLGQFLDLLAARTPAPGGGVVAAIAVAMAAGLTAMAARFSAPEMVDAEALAKRADELRTLVTAQAQADAAAYRRVLAALRVARADPAARDRVREAAAAASDVPLAVARAGADVAGLAAELAERGNSNLLGDAATAALLAAAAARAAAGLVEVNLRLGGLDDDRSRQCASLVTAAQRAARRATRGIRTGPAGS